MTRFHKQQQTTKNHCNTFGYMNAFVLVSTCSIFAFFLGQLLSVTSTSNNSSGSLLTLQQRQQSNNQIQNIMITTTEDNNLSLSSSILLSSIIDASTINVGGVDDAKSVTTSTTAVADDITTVAATYDIKNPYEELQMFLNENPNTPGAEFVRLLQEHLHNNDNNEGIRFQACWRQTNKPLCTAGLKSYKETVIEKNNENNLDEMIKNDKKRTKQKNIHLLKQVKVPIANNITVYTIHHFDNGRSYPSLGTGMVCLPLILAGYAASKDPNNVVIELGPFVGFSSKCIVSGMQVNGIYDNTYFAFDTYDGIKNYNAIIRTNPWIKNQFPEYTKDDNDYLFLWKYGVLPIYPKAVPIKGWINKYTLNMNVLNNRPISMISIDSAKSNEQLLSQLEGIGTLSKGMILFLMDFEFVQEQIQLVYGCWRLSHQYLLPVYVSWRMENWAFIIMNELNMNDPIHLQCFEQLYGNSNNNSNNENNNMKKLIIIQQMKNDLQYLIGLTNNQSIIEQFPKEWAYNPLEERMITVLS